MLLMPVMSAGVPVIPEAVSIDVGCGSGVTVGVGVGVGVGVACGVGVAVGSGGGGVPVGRTVGSEIGVDAAPTISGEVVVGAVCWSPQPTSRPATRSRAKTYLIRSIVS